MNTMQNRRHFLRTLSSAGAAGLIGAPLADAQEGRLETTSVRVAKIGGICIAAYLRSLAKTKLIPIRDPRIAECLNHND